VSAGAARALTAAELGIISKARTLARAAGPVELSAWLCDNDPADHIGLDGSDSPLLYPVALGIAQHLLSELLLMIGPAAAPRSEGHAQAANAVHQVAAQ